MNASSVEEFVKQADDYEDMDESILNVIYKFEMTRFQTHPFPALRARELKEWSQSEQYIRLLRGDYPRMNNEAGRRTCSLCGTAVTNVTFRFCPECGNILDPVMSDSDHTGPE